MRSESFQQWWPGRRGRRGGRLPLPPRPVHGGVPTGKKSFKERCRADKSSTEDNECHVPFVKTPSQIEQQELKKRSWDFPGTRGRGGALILSRRLTLPQGQTIQTEFEATRRVNLDVASDADTLSARHLAEAFVIRPSLKNLITPALSSKRLIAVELRSS